MFNSDEVVIRCVKIQDCEELLSIYAPYVLNTAITFEYEVPSKEEFTERIKNISKKYPYLVAEFNGKIAGYAYAGCFKDRSAYDWAVETTIYIDANYKKSGIGKKLYSTLENELKRQNVVNLNACIAYTENENEHLTNDSCHFHEHMGYRLVGRFTKCGYKFNEWYDMIWMEKIIGEHNKNQEPFIPYEKLKVNEEII